MFQTKINKKLFNFLLLFSLINLTILPHNLLASTTESSDRDRQLPIKFKQPKPPPDAPKVGRGQGGASRGVCHVTNSISANIIPLVPSNNWGLTASESPTLWVYVSYSSERWQSETPLTAELSVENRQTDTKLEPKTYDLELPRTSGIFSISLPYVLSSGQWYRWYLVTDCQTATFSRNNVLQIEGFLQRQEVNDSIDRPQLLSSAERVNFYTKKHLWYDAIHEAILLHCNDRLDNESKNYWQTLLKSEEVKLGRFGDRRVFCPNYEGASPQL